MFHVEHRCFPRIAFSGSRPATQAAWLYLPIQQAVTAGAILMQESLPQFMPSSAQVTVIVFARRHL
jgi:hypothetical protein